MEKLININLTVMKVAIVAQIPVVSKHRKHTMVEMVNMTVVVEAVTSTESNKNTRAAMMNMTIQAAILRAYQTKQDAKLVIGRFRRKIRSPVDLKVLKHLKSQQVIHKRQNKLQIWFPRSDKTSLFVLWNHPLKRTPLMI